MTGRNSLSNVVARGVLVALDAAKKCQAVTLKLIAGTTKEGIEHVEPYGFTSAAQDGAEAVVLFLGGDRAHGVALAVGDRRYRLQGLKRGEVALYSDEGDSIILKRDNKIEVNTSVFTVNAKEKIAFNTPLIEASGNFKAAGDVSDKTGSMYKIRMTYNGHTHPGDSGGTTQQPNQAMN
ncbi:phage baseplate assembly protein V [Pantoea sp. YU22]|uniref:phage baseplate assembly protein V n=1 Tax=Pantoea sp. YU22 TaxID=2497684 RepID=UPI000F87225A|nr:phage baseplate assembly protein V [Pantoea sp. YU22]RTY53634.1 phage baseplate assembly protein V [Pantoea sp. YU22]